MHMQYHVPVSTIIQSGPTQHPITALAELELYCDYQFQKHFGAGLSGLLVEQANHSAASTIVSHCGS
jgi:hypothetical protein